jgi:hypothetical protein
MEQKSTIVDFLENAIGANISEIERIIGRAPDEILRQRDALAERLGDAWLGQSLMEQRVSEGQGELWPVLPRSAPDVVELMKRTGRTNARLGSPRRDAESSKRQMQSLLLYAHGIHVPNPLRISVVNDMDASKDFLRAITQICLWAPLIRDGVIRIFEEPEFSVRPAPEHTARLEELTEHIGLALMSYEGNRQVGTYRQQAASILIERALAQLVDMAGMTAQTSGSLLMPSPYDAPTVNALAGLLTDLFAAQSGPSLNDHYAHLNQLIAMELPGLGNLDLRHMTRIRDDESFGIFRSDIAAALVDAGTDVAAGQISSARRIVSEHMDAGVARLNARTRQGVLGDALLGGAIGWGLGAAVAASVAGLQGAIATLIGRGATDMARKWPKPSQRALRAHYVELGTASLAKREDPIDFMAFTTDELWGPSLGNPMREENSRSVVRSLLDHLSDDDRS